MTTRKILVTILLLSLIGFQSLAQKQGQERIDSLLSQLPLVKEDSIRLLLLIDLSFVYKFINANEGIKWGQTGLALAEKLKWKNGIVDAMTVLGTNHFNKSEYVLAQNYYGKAMEMAKIQNYNDGIAKLLICMGTVCRVLSNYTLALDYDLKALKMAEELGNINTKANALWDIGNIYLEQSDLTNAMEYLSKALNIYEEQNNVEGEANALNDIGLAYFLEKKSSRCFEYLYKALDINERLGYKRGMATNLIGIGINYGDLFGDYPRAIEFQFKGLELITGLGYRREIIFALSNIGEYYLKIAGDTTLKTYPDSLRNKAKVLHNAISYLEEAIKIEKETGLLYSLQYSSRNISDAYALMGNYKVALESYRLHNSVKDSIFSLESNRRIAGLEAKRVTDLKQKEIEIQKLELERARNEKYGLLVGSMLMALIALVSYKNFRNKKRDNKIITLEKQRSEELLLNILPSEVADELKTTGSAKAKSFTLVTVMFTDFKDFTAISEKVSAELLVEEINNCFSAFDNILLKYKIEKIKTIGDAYLCASGMPVSNYTHAVDMLNAAFEIRDYMLHRKKEKEARGEIPFELRIGIHTGPVVAGIVGVRKYAYDIWGDTVNLAARMEASGEAGKVNISGSTYELVNDKFTCIHRGKIQAKNKGEIDMYFVESISI